ncbi:MAG: response regulator [Candidatus Poribacteria bacterium]|nr:response regulator [Candidatus Poribacteria bacterium]
MEKETVEALGKLVPPLLWFILAIVVLLRYDRPIRELLSNLSHFKFMDMELSFVRNSIDEAIEVAEKAPQWKVTVPPRAKEQVLNRVKQHLQIFRDVQILWVDDRPENNRNESRMFRQLKAEIDTATNTADALSLLRKGNYDLVISDMARGDEATAGLKFLAQFRRANQTTPVIFYIGEFDPDKGVPGGGFGITNRPDELLHLTLDALERRKQ